MERIGSHSSGRGPLRRTDRPLRHETAAPFFSSRATHADGGVPAPFRLDPRVRERTSRGTRPSRYDGAAKVAIGLATALLVWAALRIAPITVGWSLWTAIGIAGFAYSGFVLFHAIRYRPVEPVAHDALPTVTVVVPAFNEGPMVQTALISALESDYPRDRLHVLAVDDGSTDDTWTFMEAVARAFPDRVTAIKMPKNGGKREALRAGFLAARGEVVVTVDSDSRLAKDAIRSIVAPIARDREVAAVAGKVVVLNRYESVFTRLLAARFFVTFDLGRAVQSRFGAVLCCPGALTAYRREAVLAVLDRWSSQTFLGVPCTIGEDRALTTWLLRTGHRAVYQSSATVETLVPTHLRGVTKMLLRWERGNVRESVVMLPHLFTQWRPRDRAWPTLEILLDIVQYPFITVAAVLAARHFVMHPLDLLRAVGFVMLGAFVQSLYVLRSEKSTDFLWNVGYAAFAFLGLQWIYPWSCITMRNGSWMTR